MPVGSQSTQRCEMNNETYDASLARKRTVCKHALFEHAPLSVVSQPRLCGIPQSEQMNVVLQTMFSA